MDPDGDVVVVEVQVVGPKKTMKFLHGTGKWKGIKGEAKGKTTAPGKPIVPGTVQSCSRYVGTFELQKQAPKAGTVATHPSPVGDTGKRPALVASGSLYKLILS